MDFEFLKQECLACRKCGLCETRHNVVFGMGSPTAEVMFIGEGPGQNEDEQGLPFVGRSGKLLDQYLEAVDLSREKNVFIANMPRCSPSGSGCWAARRRSSGWACCPQSWAAPSGPTPVCLKTPAPCPPPRGRNSPPRPSAGGSRA